MVRRAAFRGELPSGTDINLVCEIPLGAPSYLVVLGPRRSDAQRVHRAIDAIRDGVMCPRRRRRGNRRTNPPSDS